MLRIACAAASASFALAAPAGAAEDLQSFLSLANRPAEFAYLDLSAPATSALQATPAAELQALALDGSFLRPSALLPQIEAFGSRYEGRHSGTFGGWRGGGNDGFGDGGGWHGGLCRDDDCRGWGVHAVPEPRSLALFATGLLLLLGVRSARRRRGPLFRLGVQRRYA